MATLYSGRMLDYMGSGLLANRPVTLNLFPGSVGFYFATDAQTLHMWSVATSSWSTIPLGTGVPEAPGDGQIYARQNALWVAIRTLPQSILTNGDCRIAQRASAALVNNTRLFAGCDMISCTPAGYTTLTAGTLQQSALAGTSCGLAQFASNVTTTGSGTITFMQRAELLNSITFGGKRSIAQVKVYHDVGSAVNVTVTLSSANAANNFAAVTTRATSTTSIASGAVTTIYLPVTLSAAEAANGLQMTVAFATGAVTTKNFAVSDMSWAEGTSQQLYVPPPYTDSLQRCKRYFRDFSNLMALVSSGPVANINKVIFETPMAFAPTITQSTPSGTGASWAALATALYQAGTHSVDAGTTTLLLASQY